ncbi:hypothetical protein BDR07DRAFT_1433188 [Suillus spraguei]|nr:hypothetical protein BDR07DRAFT_1433188 [Suillus spraguei]
MQNIYTVAYTYGSSNLLRHRYLGALPKPGRYLSHVLDPRSACDWSDSDNVVDFQTVYYLPWSSFVMLLMDTRTDDKGHNLIMFECILVLASMSEKKLASPLRRPRNLSSRC